MSYKTSLLSGLLSLFNRSVENGIRVVLSVEVLNRRRNISGGPMDFGCADARVDFK